MTPFWLALAFLLTTGAPLDHVLAAHQAQTPDVPATLLLRQAWEESRWQAPEHLLVSRLEGGRRRTGYLHSFAGTRGPYFCGALQLKRKTPSACRAINADLVASYREAVRHIMQWKSYCLRTKRAGKDWRLCAYAGYGGGVKATKTRGRGYRYALRIINGRTGT